MGFEPMELLPVHALSKRAYSASLAPLRTLTSHIILIGESGIRTHDLKNQILVFETSSLNHSDISPIQVVTDQVSILPKIYVNIKTVYLMCKEKKLLITLLIQTILWFFNRYS